jgi:hypothetical protein
LAVSLLSAAKACELHVHPAGVLTSDDVLELCREDYRDIDWSFFVDSYEKAYGFRPDPVSLIEDALTGPAGTERFRDHLVYGPENSGDFGRFGAKMSPIYCVLEHLQNTYGRFAEAQRLCLKRQRLEGVAYTEYRCMTQPDIFDRFHRANLNEIMSASRDGLKAGYIISLRRSNALEDYAAVRTFMDAHPETIPYIVGLDFCHIEEGHPPKTLGPFYEHLIADNKAHPERALEVVNHVGESFFDKSLESAVRWCHEAATMGAVRLGHATALGLPPAVAIARRPDAHVTELVSERIDQIAYDLVFGSQLTAHGIEIDTPALTAEREDLLKLDPDEILNRPYDDRRLEEVIARQRFVLDCLAGSGTVIETCPASNLLIGGVPGPENHPIHLFLASKVNLAICSDDPGVFATTLADEVDWVLTHSNLSAPDLEKRLDDPYRFRLAQLRPKV